MYPCNLFWQCFREDVGLIWSNVCGVSFSDLKQLKTFLKTWKHLKKRNIWRWRKIACKFHKWTLFSSIYRLADFLQENIYIVVILCKEDTTQSNLLVTLKSDIIAPALGSESNLHKWTWESISSKVKTWFEFQTRLT